MRRILAAFALGAGVLAGCEPAQAPPSPVPPTAPPPAAAPARAAQAPSPAPTAARPAPAPAIVAVAPTPPPTPAPPAAGVSVAVAASPSPQPSPPGEREQSAASPSPSPPEERGQSAASPSPQTSPLGEGEQSAAPTATPTAAPLAVATPEAAPTGSLRLEVEVVAEGFQRPVFVGHAPDGSGRLYVIEKRGVIWVLPGGQNSRTPFLDISERVGSQSNEQGLFSVAFHPGYAANGRLFVNYTDLDGNTVVAEFRADAPAAAADPGSERVLLQVEQPYSNHNGGMLAFGPRDGYLYVGMGDGGSGGDPLGHGQNPATLLGALLRLDVDGGQPYQIPADNPFVGDPGRRPEVFAYGLRNPWRFAFDRMTGDLWIADVGQNDLEEVDLALAPLRGGLNFGWNAMEGGSCFPPALGAFARCAPEDYQLPIAEYGRAQGCSITGGYAYRGRRFPALAAAYVFGDYCSGRIWTLQLDDRGAWRMVQRAQVDVRISSFGEDEQGELYITDDSGGRLLRLRANDDAPSG